MKLPWLSRVIGIHAFKDSILKDRFAEVVILGARKEICLRCDPDTDEILITHGAPKRRGHPVKIVTGSFRPQWIWTLTNQLGYLDGVRIQLASPRGERDFEFIAAASCIEVYEPKKIRSVFRR